MKLSFLFSQMQSGELRQLSVVDSSTGKMKPEKYQSVVDMINSGLIDLHTQLKIKIGEVRVPVDPAIEVYDLGVIDPFVKTRFLQVHDVTDAHGRAIPFNDFGSHMSVHFTSRTVLHAPKHVRDFHGVSEIVVKYRAMPKLLGCCDDDIDPDVIDVDLDYMYAQALCYWVASRLHGTVGLQDGTHSINSYVSLYNAEVQRLNGGGFEQSFVGNHDAAFVRGWP